MTKNISKDTAEKAPICKMSEWAMKQTEIVRNSWCVTPPAGTDVESLLNPESWSILARQLRPRDRIEAMPEDGSWLAEFVVLRTSPSAAHVKILNHWAMGNEDVDDETEFYSKWQSPATKWCVFRRVDNERVEMGFDSQVAADQWILDNTAKRAA